MTVVLRLRATDGSVHAYERYEWTVRPQVRVMLDVVLRAALRARRGGLRIELVEAPDGLADLLRLHGYAVSTAGSPN